MNDKQDCNNCIKHSVCVLGIEYNGDCERIEKAIRSMATIVSIKCKEFYPKQTPLMRSIQDEG